MITLCAQFSKIQSTLVLKLQFKYNLCSYANIHSLSDLLFMNVPEALTAQLLKNLPVLCKQVCGALSGYLYPVIIKIQEVSMVLVSSIKL